MRHERKKIGRIVDELINIFYKRAEKTLDIKIVSHENATVIHLIEFDTDYTDQEIQDFAAVINKKRQRDVEEYYWQLAGETDEDEELILISSMIDQLEATIKDGDLYMTFTRLKEEGRV